MKKLTKGQVALITIVLVLIVDQAVKIWVKTHMYIGESIRVTDWFYIAFIENNGMAFGMEVGSKLFLSLFRIVAVVFLSWWLFYGRVVYMLFFPLFSFYWPDWIPWIGGERFEFFRPVFNIADSAISVGVVCMILFYHRYLSSENKQVEKSE